VIAVALIKVRCMGTTKRRAGLLRGQFSSAKHTETAGLAIQSENPR
jgi:hypothetical protein